jgi:hypothetical protein
MRRASLIVLFAAAGSWWFGSFAFGQAAAPRAPVVGAIPLALPLGKVPVGRWATYRMSDASGTTSFKMVVVGHQAKVSEIETIVEGGSMAALGQTVLRTSINNDTGADLHPDRHVVQLGENPPMLIPMQIVGGQVQTFRKPDPKTRVGVESVTVAGGTYPRAEHYQEKAASGAVVDCWVSRDVPPFGLLKLQAGADAQGRPIVLELTAHGENARSTITAAIQPFDRMALVKQLQPLIVAQQAAAAGNPAGRVVAKPAGTPGAAPQTRPSVPSR